MNSYSVAVLAASMLALSLPQTATAYATGSALTESCHEELTVAAIHNTGWPDGQAAPRDGDIELMAEFLPYQMAVEDRDAWSVPLVMGVRHPDFKSASPSDFVHLDAIHALDENQREHCLRRRDDNGLQGNAEAVEACRAFIREQVSIALGPDEFDAAGTETVAIWLAFGGTTDLEINRYAFRMGVAIHALQDSFSHSFRTPDGHRILSVLNYVDTAGGDYDEERDGAEHQSQLDDCRSGTPYMNRRLSQTQTATEDLLRATHTGTRAERMTQVEAVLDDWVVFMSQNCVPSNRYCDNEALAEPVMGCATTFAGGAPLSTTLACLLLFSFVLVRRRRTPFVALLVVCLLVPVGVHAQELQGAGVGEGGSGSGRESEAQEGLHSNGLEEAGPPEIREAQREGLEVVRTADVELERGTEQDLREVAEVVEEESDGATSVLAVDEESEEMVVLEVRRQEDDGGFPVNHGLGFAVNVFGGIDGALLGFSAGLRLDISDRFILGLDAEWQRWFSLETGNGSRGVANVYATAHVVYATFKRIELRSNLHAGISVLLFDYPSAEKGSLGPFFGFTPIALAIRASRGVRINIDPGGIFFAIPALGTGVPLAHRHHRFSVGVTLSI